MARGRTRGRLPPLEASREQLREQKLELDAAVNNMPIGLVMFDRHKRLIVSNELYRSMYGLPRELMQRGMHLRVAGTSSEGGK